MYGRSDPCRRRNHLGSIRLLWPAWCEEPPSRSLRHNEGGSSCGWSTEFRAVPRRGYVFGSSWGNQPSAAGRGWELMSAEESTDIQLGSRILCQSVSVRSALFSLLASFMRCSEALESDGVSYRLRKLRSASDIGTLEPSATKTNTVVADTRRVDSCHNSYLSVTEDLPIRSTDVRTSTECASVPTAE